MQQAPPIRPPPAPGLHGRIPNHSAWYLSKRAIKHTFGVVMSLSAAHRNIPCPARFLQCIWSWLRHTSCFYPSLLLVAPGLNYLQLGNKSTKALSKGHVSFFYARIIIPQLLLLHLLCINRAYTCTASVLRHSNTATILKHYHSASEELNKPKMRTIGHLEWIVFVFHYHGMAL